jgi:predicted ATPase/class 3 adenylate cyclase
VAVGAPTGTVTFLFTDVEGSTRLWEAAPDAMRTALARHDEIVRGVIGQHGGHVFSSGGDGVAAAFNRAGDAVATALEAQGALAGVAWPDSARIRVRMGLHTGEVEERDGDYLGAAVNRAARLMAVAHGGQVVCSDVTAGLVEGVALADLGEHRLRDLSAPQRVFQVGQGSFPQLRSLNVLPGNLPGQPTHFVGRVDELGRVRSAVDQSRLVTLTGVGGVGKTRLALQAAAELSPAFPDGAWVVELAGLIEPGLVAPNVAAVLGVQTPAGRSVEDCLADAFGARDTLVVLDNCEHVIGAAAELALRLVSSPGTSRVLATSREGLGVPGERVIAVPPLSVPPTDAPGLVLASDAVRLFVERAADARDGFSVGEADAPTLARLCRRLDGIPLAIELAAARVRSSSPDDILAHLDQRFRLLSAGRRTAPTRQQTLRNAIDWSHELLSQQERALLRRLSVFGGGFDVPAVEAIAADTTLDAMDVVDLVDRLVDKSLVTLDASSGATRYRLLESIRDYALERLTDAGETQAFVARHAAFFASFSERAGAGLRGPDEGVWTKRVEVELENLRLALTWAIEAGEADLALRVVAGLALSGYGVVGCPFGDTALGAAELEAARGHRLRPLALSSAAYSASRRGEYERATPLAEAALVEARAHANSRDGRRRLAEVLAVLGTVCMTRPGYYNRAVEVCGQRECIAVELDEPYQRLQSLLLRAGIHAELEAAEEALRLSSRVGNPSMRSYALFSVGMLLTRPDPVRARALLEEAVEIATEVGNRDASAYANESLANVLDTVGEHLSAARIRLTSAQQSFASGARAHAYVHLFGVAENLNDVGDREPAIILGAWVQRQVVAAGWDLDRVTDNNVSAETAASAHTAEFAYVVRGELNRLEPQVAGMSDKDALALAEDRVNRQELLAGIGQRGSSRTG